LTTGSGTFLAGDHISATYSRVAGEHSSPPTYHITATLVDPDGKLGNYIVTNDGAEFTINKRTATWTTNNNSKIYGQPDPNPLTTGSGSNFVMADNVTATYTRVAGENPSPPTYHITATLSPSGVLDNYTITNTGAEFSINQPQVPPTIIVTDGDNNQVPCGGTTVMANNGQCAAAAVTLTITAIPDPSCPGPVMRTATRSDGHTITIDQITGAVTTDPFPLGSTTVTVMATDNCGSPATCVFNVVVTSDRTIASNFNGTPIAGNNYIWFNAILKPTLPSGNAPVTVRFFNQRITSSQFNLTVPNTTVIFTSNVTCASAAFTNGEWVITAPKSGLSGNTFLSGLAYQVPAQGLPGGLNPVSWSGTFVTDTPGVKVNWAWSAAVYTNFNTDYNALNVKATDDNHHDCVTLNSDHTGTPEAYKSNVIGGARGGGGSNYTGSLSGTKGVAPCDTL
jgi:hypothetical protein